MARRAGRRKNQLQDCYFEGYLERSFRDKTSQKLWTCLIGNKLFFFNDIRDSDYVDKLDLSEFISATDDNSPDRNLDAARFNLQMKNGNIKFTAPNAEARELWKGYIQSVAQLSVPTSLNLLPGQIHVLREVIQREKDRASNSASNTVTDSPYISLKADMPACYHKVSRMEAELLLEREAKKGNLILRPGRDKISFAITTRQDLDGAVFRHYRVSRRHEGGFIIDVDSPVPCATLHDVIAYLVEKTGGNLIPLIMEGSYEKTISFISSDNESGEITQQALTNPGPPSLPPKPVPLKILLPKPEADPEENSYLNDVSQQQTVGKEKQTDDYNTTLLPRQTATKKVLMPPTPALRKTFLATLPSSSSSSPLESRITANIDTEKQIPQAAISELKLKLQQKAKCQK
ncbi:signal-transducing adaptor protein 1-like isoform X2 [Melanotaenia boesemani]|uniref:signal-transducing adaptor protein 1-like isoform X2 n=1 Tax=Melanotaenia boesemani TaxID=1250792 RepID=UPI001C05E84B|nr:signal-transducing adaptor protein 1-like isoform X2 [Melanotaenia boesemani]